MTNDERRLDAISHARNALDVAFDDLGRAYREAFPVGAWVEWAHGRHTRSGFVEETCGDGRYATLLVRSDAQSGRVVRVNPWSVWRFRTREGR